MSTNERNPRSPREIGRRALVVSAGLAVLLVGACRASDDERGSGSAAMEQSVEARESRLPANPHLGPTGTATMHGDSASSDTTSYAGPGVGHVEVQVIDVGAVCPTVLIGGDGYPVALCTRIEDLRPVVHLLDPRTGSPLASIETTAGSLLGGVYGYLDHADRMVLVDGSADLLRIGHRRDAGAWVLEVEERIPLAASIPEGDSVTSVAPDHRHGVWFATGGGTVGLVDTKSGSVDVLGLPAGERISNSISTAPVGMSVATDHAVYLVRRGDDGELDVRWRHEYDRGPARKPGQLSWGTGSTPTFFGPTDGADYVVVVDNADPQVHLVVIRTSGSRAGERVCAPVVLAHGGPGSEDSPIGVGNTVVVTSTYGYEYPRLPEDAGPSRPPEAEFVGGMTRVEVEPDGSDCAVVWDSSIRSSAVPRLSTADGTITTMAQQGDGAGDAYAVMDVETGEVLAQQGLGTDVGDPLQLAGTIGPGRVLYQGTLGAILRITPSPAQGSE